MSVSGAGGTEAPTRQKVKTMLVGACNKENRAVGVCLHVYLERDFLTLEGIVYPKRAQWNMMGNYYPRPGALTQPLPPLPDLDANTTSSRLRENTRRQRGVGMRGRHQHKLPLVGETKGRGKRSAPGNYAVTSDAYGTHGWVEGPELEDYCSRLGTVITCFEEVLIDCDNGYDFFRYRHLLHSLSHVHHYLCHTPEDRSSKFLPFLKLIDCAEKTREKMTSCHRPNITLNVWNQILRAEVGPEICDSLNTQRACLLDNNYLRDECGTEREELYRNVSGLFLGIWCRLPLYQRFYSSGTTSHHHYPSLYLTLVLVFLLHQMRLPSSW
ncbi:uncharacterized protein LOC135099903 isoform X2 [Scylla paramamosain]|uniref:uncharacterized protein LOC135099903 isoform X2 n=1 Tax=Scylla paramamosain TaxID=85552 RepID=UPI003082C673